MQTSLGVYIEDNIIKYAKLQKDKENIKIENYNMVFYDGGLDQTLNRIISETYSYKVPISINVSNEIYNEFQISSLLNKKDTKKAVKIEYEMLCSEKDYNIDSLEHRYLLVEEKQEADKQKALNIIVNKNDISKKSMAFDGRKLNTITPISTSIVNLTEIQERENIAIVNIENKTKITTVIDGQIYQIDVLDEGMGMILDEINKVENSYSKSYDVCKNMTLYTQNSSELYSETSEYMGLVTGILYKIVQKTKEIISQFFSSVEKVYITGLGTCINNIDLYFQDYMPEAKCEILKPYFIGKETTQMPIKEYVEVNSAIALALDGLGMVNKEINFSKTKVAGGSKGDSLWSQDISFGTIKSYFVGLGRSIKEDFSAPFQSFEKTIIRMCSLCVILAVMFVIFSHIIEGQITDKKNEIAGVISKVDIELSEIDSDIALISGRTATYNSLIQELTAPKEEIVDVTTKRIVSKDAIPNLLNRVMFAIPKKVKLTSIENTTATHIVIKAEAEKYEQLGYFKAVLTTSEILKNVKSTPGQKSDTIVQVTIEGDLP